MTKTIKPSEFFLETTNPESRLDQYELSENVPATVLHTGGDEAFYDFESVIDQTELK